jgi:hypothetical protein
MLRHGRRPKGLFVANGCLKRDSLRVSGYDGFPRRGRVVRATRNSPRELRERATQLVVEDRVLGLVDPPPRGREVGEERAGARLGHRELDVTGVGVSGRGRG